MLKQIIEVLFLNLLIVIIIGRPLIKLLYILKAGQAIREDGPQNHQKKKGTPTMGGIIFIVPALLITLALTYSSKISWLIVFTIFAFMFLGWLDDFLIIKKKNNKGIPGNWRLLFEVIFGVIFSIGIILSNHNPVIKIPFSSQILTFESVEWIYVIFIVLVMTSCTNALNITDGLDGLLTGLSAIGISGLVILLQIQNNNDPLMLTACILGAAIVGGCIGFLWFNSNPASVFMGNTGSLGLGAIVAVIAIIGHLELWVIILGFVFVMETLSVIIQVIYFKVTKGKRIFKMSPLHHHFELSGWAEPKIVARFYLIGLICLFITILGYK